MDKNIDVLETLNKNRSLSQREIAKKCEISVGKVNSILRNLEEEKYITYSKNGRKYNYNLTSKAIELLENTLRKNRDTKIKVLQDTKRRVNQAVILAAGEQADFFSPVGVLELEQGVSFISRIIELLIKNHIENIIIIVGYNSDKYDVFKNSKNITIIRNDKYKWTGTMASLALAEPKINGDFILIENDLLFEDRVLTNLIDNKSRDCVVITPESGSKDEAFVELRNEIVYKISKDIHALNKIDGELVGISKISIDVFKKMMQEFRSGKNPYINYEYTLLDVARYYDIGYIRLNDLIWAEVDNKDHYDNVKNYIYPILKRKESQTGSHELKNCIEKVISIDFNSIECLGSQRGINNKNYKVKIENDNYIITLLDSEEEEINNRSLERINSEKAYNSGVGVKYTFFSDNMGVKILPINPEWSILTETKAKAKGNMELINKALKILHESDIKFENTFDVLKIINNYENILDISKLNKTYIDYDNVKCTMINSYCKLNLLNIDMRPCHNNIVPENLIKSTDERIYLIEWEHSSMNDPIWDIASFCLECNLNKDEENLFLTNYYGKSINIEMKRRILTYKILQDFIWALRLAIKEIKNSDDQTYGIQRYNRAKINLKILLKE